MMISKNVCTVKGIITQLFGGIVLIRHAFTDHLSRKKNIINLPPPDLLFTNNCKQLPCK